MPKQRGGQLSTLVIVIIVGILCLSLIAVVIGLVVGLKNRTSGPDTEKCTSKSDCESGFICGDDKQCVASNDAPIVDPNDAPVVTPVVIAPITAAPVSPPVAPPPSQLGEVGQNCPCKTGSWCSVPDNKCYETCVDRGSCKGNNVPRNGYSCNYSGCLDPPIAPIAPVTTASESPPPASDGYKQVHSVQNKGLCLTAAGSGTANSTNIHMGPCFNTAAQLFKYEPSTGFIRYKRDPTKCVHIYGSDTITGNQNVTLWDCIPNHPRFKWIKDGNMLRSAAGSNNCMHVYGAQNIVSGQNVSMWNNCASNNNRFNWSWGE